MIDSSSLKMMEPIPVRPGFTLYILDCTSSLYAVKVLVTRGLGPTKLMSPFKMLIICGSSLSLFS